MKWLLKFRLLMQMTRFMNRQTEVIEAQEAEIVQLKLAVLANQQAYRDLAVAFRIALEKPEVDLRDDLDLLIRDLSDQVATLEEHFVA